MRVLWLRTLAATSWSYTAGEVYDMPDDAAQRWIASGHAAPVRDDAHVEAAAEGAMPERATLPRATKRPA